MSQYEINTDVQYELTPEYPKMLGRVNLAFINELPPVQLMPHGVQLVDGVWAVTKYTVTVQYHTVVRLDVPWANYGESDRVEGQRIEQDRQMYERLYHTTEG